jgi:hypothetical protein
MSPPPDETTRPGGGITLVGPFWTRRRVARHLGTPEHEVARLGMLRLDAPTAVEEAYPEFQFDDAGARRDVVLLATLLRRRVDDAAACDWLFRPNGRLHGLPPMQWLAEHGRFEALLEALPVPKGAEVGGRDLEQARAAWQRMEAGEPAGLTTPWDKRS